MDRIALSFRETLIFLTRECVIFDVEIGNTTEDNNKMQSSMRSVLY